MCGRGPPRFTRKPRPIFILWPSRETRRGLTWLQTRFPPTSTTLENGISLRDDPNGIWHERQNKKEEVVER